MLDVMGRLDDVNFIEGIAYLQSDHVKTSILREDVIRIQDLIPEATKGGATIVAPCSTSSVPLAGFLTALGNDSLGRSVAIHVWKRQDTTR